MADAIVQLDGFKELEEDLKQMPTRVIRAVTRKGLRKGGSILVKALKKNSPKKRTGTLRKALKVNYSKKWPFGWAGIKKIRGESRSRNYYFTLERGRKSYSTRHGARAGSPQMARFSWILQTAGSVEAQVESAIVAGIQTALNDAVAKSKVIRNG